MKILLHSYVFLPSIGGIESATQNLAAGLSRLGHAVTVLTDTLSGDESDRAAEYTIIRSRDERIRSQCVAENDLVHATGTFPGCFPHALSRDKPFSWTHQNYRLQAIDGLGWCDDGPTPLAPLQSYRYHSSRMGRVQAMKQLCLLYGRRMIAAVADANVAITRHVQFRQPLPRQQVIYNPVDYSFFRTPSRQEAMEELRQSDATFSFLGRLVSEKGVDDLIRAFALLVRQSPEGSRHSLKIVGDGPRRQYLESLAKQLNVFDRIRFAGALSGEALRNEIRRSGIFVLPSAWEEPMGIVAVELMSAGKPLVVSKIGGLSECCADACITFTNGDVDSLAHALRGVADSAALQSLMIERGIERAKQFDLQRIATQYSNLFERIHADRSRTRGKER